jgi:hypothetical protein
MAYRNESAIKQEGSINSINFSEKFKSKKKLE